MKQYNYHYGTVWSDDLDAILVVMRDARDAGVNWCVCEGAWLGQNARTFGDLRSIAGKTEALAETAGLGILPPISPSVWQHSILTVNGATPRTRDDLKASSRWVATVLVGHSIKGDDVADAICLCEYAACNHMEGHKGLAQKPAGESVLAWDLAVVKPLAWAYRTEA